ncbi:capsule assembly Wzi family protein [Tellurirhabdus bombi]|uniref:capsule assembly Wzi family protein n=1 Tax=Tellurirhabdus bombi TaxID=2907205 RepID=UPI001F2AE84C|nr:capsule assembly Wzi family protein [Tellurirhabdus bombi]
MRHKTYGFLLCFLFFFQDTIAQQIGMPHTHQFRVEAGAYASSNEQLPFWLRANQYGIVPLTGPLATLRVGAYSDYRKPYLDGSQLKKKTFDWGYGVELVGNGGGKEQAFLLPEAYVKARLGIIELYAGRRREIIGLADTTLTSGSYAWSGNALPIPKIQIGTPGFVPVPFTKNLFSVNAFYSHGWFNNQGLVKDYFLHQKALYVQLGKSTWPFRLYGGINHNVQWGGNSKVLSSAVAINGQLPSRLKDYWYVVSSQTRSFMEDTTVRTSMEDNRIGNHLGSVDIGLDFTMGDFNVLVYRQNLYDDGSLFLLTNIADGLNGLRIQNRRMQRSAFHVKELLAEFLYTKSQGGDVFLLIPGRGDLRGRDNYFNHSQYIDGWTVNDKIIGSPFLTPRNETDLGTGAPQAIANNRLSMFHLAANGLVGERTEWMVKASYSRNFGTYDRPFADRADQLSLLLNVSVPFRLRGLGEMKVNTSLALDQGNLFRNTTGIYIGLRKELFSGPSIAPPFMVPGQN